MRAGSINQQEQSNRNDVASLDNAKLPARTWNEWAKETARDVGFKAAFGAASLGLSGLGGIEEKRAEAGIVLSMDPQADQRAINNGVGFSVAGGGNSGYLRGDYNYSGGSGTFYASAVFIDPYTAISSGHNVRGTEQFNTRFSIGTGPNFNSNPGSLYEVSNVIMNPGYAASGTRANAADIVIFKFANPVAGVSTIQIADGRPAPNSEVWMAGFGQGGNAAVGYLPLDGNLRAGTSVIRDTIPPLGGASSLLYGNAYFDNVAFNQTGLRAAPGDSGGGVFTDNKLLGLMTAAPFSASGAYTTYLDLSVPSTREFVLSNSSTAVPEPSGLLMLGAATVGAAFLRKRLTKSPVRD
jgi:hypothetical protein